MSLFRSNFMSLALFSTRQQGASLQELLFYLFFGRWIAVYWPRAAGPCLPNLPEPVLNPH